jgi:deoxyribodipyrimidine photo-lyase
LKNNCPIQEFPEEISPHQLERDPILEHDPDLAQTTGPLTAVANDKPELVMLTIDSLGDADPALIANPDLPVVFVFNEMALQKLQLSSQRIGFYLQTLEDLSSRKDLKVYLGDPYLFAQHNSVAVTFAPVPSFKKFKNLAEIHPYPWFKRPHSGSVKSYTSWRKSF